MLALAFGIGMVILGMPRYGIQRAFVRSWPLFVAYVMTAMTAIVFGAALVLNGLLTTSGPR
jgi:hypothetical protein